MIYFLSPKSPHVLGNLLKDLATLSPKEWTVEIKEKTKKRTNPQNALYWKYMDLIGGHFGYTKDEMHEEIAARFLGMMERQTRGGELIREPRSTTTLTTKEFGEYMDKIIALGRQENIKLPQPEYFGL